MLPLAAWELPSEHELAAVYGQEPMLSIAKAGIPLPPSRKESAGFLYGRQAAAIKQALIYQVSLAKAERRRVSHDNYRATATFARKAGAPKVFSHYQDLLAGNELSPREEYLVSQALNLMVQWGYGIDTLQIRLLSESLQLPVEVHTAYLVNLPMGALCELVPAGEPPRERLVADLQMMGEVLRNADALLQKVTDRASADAAAAGLLEMLPLWNTTLHTRLHLGKIRDLTGEEKQCVQMVTAAGGSLLNARRALAEKHWYHSPSLQFVDMLLR